MDSLLTLVLEAHSQEHNHHRRYEVALGLDLFQDWTLDIHYGRVGQGGGLLRFASSRPDAIRAIIRERLRRRLSAPQRIGCSYRLSAFTTAAGFDASCWLPGEVMARFFAQFRQPCRDECPEEEVTFAGKAKS